VTGITTATRFTALATVRVNVRSSAGMFALGRRPFSQLTVLFPFFLFFTARAASGSDPRAAITLSYHVATGCPSEGDFREAVAARTKEAEWATPNEVTERDLDVSVVNDRDTFKGRLTVHKAGTPSATRHITGESCDEVIAALALVAALAIDPQAVTSPLPARSAPVTPVTEPVPEASEASRADGIAPPLPPQPSALPEITSSLNDQRDQRWVSGKVRPTVHALWHMATGVDASVVSGVFPSAAIAVTAFFEVGVNGGLFSPAFRLDVTGSERGWEPTGPGSTQLLWLTSELEACPLRLAIGKKLYVAPCLFGNFGLLRIQGQIAGQSAVMTQSRPWAAIGLLGRARWWLGTGMFVEVSGGLRAPLGRDTLIFEVPQRVAVYTVPVAGAHVGIGLGYSFH